MTNLPDALTTLEAVLDHLAAALITGRPDDVLRAEDLIAPAVWQVVDLARSSTVDRAHLYGRVQAVRVAMAKCGHLGRSSSALLQVVMPRPSYSAVGVVRPVHTPTVQSRA